MSSYVQKPNGAKSSRGARLNSDGSAYRGKPLFLTKSVAAVIGTSAGFVREINAMAGMTDTNQLDGVYQAWHVYYLGPDWEQYTRLGITIHNFAASGTPGSIAVAAFGTDADPGTTIDNTALALARLMTMGESQSLKLSCAGGVSVSGMGRCLGQYLLLGGRNDTSGTGAATGSLLTINVSALPS